MTGRAVGYIRRSSGKESPLSLTAQTEAIQAAATERGDVITLTYRDHGRSGGDADRPAFLEMMAAIEDGTVAAVYAYDADRLSRRESTLHLLLDAAGERGTAVVDRTGRDLAASTNRLTAGVLASVDAQVLRDITERNRANRDEKVRRGDDLGEAPFGWSKMKLSEPGYNSKGDPAEAGASVNVCTDPRAITTVLNAYHATGSALGAARLLNAAGTPTKRGRTWNNRAVATVVRREAPELLPAGLGRVHPRHFRVRVLSGLLRCNCGTVMSPNGPGWTCAQGQRGAHARPYNVAEARVLPWVREEADRLDVGVDLLESAPVEGDREALEAKRSRLIDLYLDGSIKKALLDEKGASIDAAIAALDRRTYIDDVPQAIDWTRWDAEGINAALRALWERVQLGPDMRPVEAVWRVPEWRS